MNLRALRTPIAPAGAITHARVPASADVALTLIHRHGCVSLQNLADLLGCSKVYAHRVAGSVRSERFKCRDRWRIRYLPVMPGQAARQPARAV
jgi:hypothetical protein